jgi:hypothetical protein
MDSENSGAIFRLKNLALVRSSFVAAANKEGSNRSTTTPQNVAVGPASFEVAAVNKMFDEIYRATPMPSVILQQNNYNSNYWDQGHNFTPGLPATANSFGSADSSSSMNQNSFSYSYHQLAHHFNHQHKSLNPYENQHQYTQENTQSLSSQFYTIGNGINNQWISPIPAPPLETFRLPSQTHVTKEIDNGLHQNSCSLVDRDHSHEEPAYPHDSGGYSFESTALSDADPYSTVAENVSVGPDDEVIEVEPTVEGHVHSNSPKAASSIYGSVVQTRNSIDSKIASDLSSHTGRSRQRRKYVMDSLFQLSSKPAAPQVSSSSRIEVSLLDDISHDKTSANKKVQGIVSSDGSSISTQSKRDDLTNGLGRESGLANEGNDSAEDDENVSEDPVNSNSNEKSSKKSAGLSFISNLKQSRMSKGRDDSKRFGSLILVPQLSSIRYSSEDDEDYKDSSSSSSSSGSGSGSGSGKKKSGRLVKKTAVSEPKANLISESICKKAFPDKQTDDCVYIKKSTALKSTKQSESKSDENKDSSKNVPDESPKATTKKSLEPEPASQPSGDAHSHVLNSSPTTRSRKALENSTKDPPEGDVLQSDLERAPSARRVTAKDPPEDIVLQSDLERAPSARRVTAKDPPEGIVLQSDLERAPSARRVQAKDPPEGIVLPSDIEATSSSTSNSSRTDGTWSPEEVWMMLAC